MYQFALYKGVSPPFTLLIGQPYEEIPLKPLANTMISHYKDLLLHVRKEECGHDYDFELLQHFTTSINVCLSMVACKIIFKNSILQESEVSTSNAAETSGDLSNLTGIKLICNSYIAINIYCGTYFPGNEFIEFDNDRKQYLEAGGANIGE